MNYNLNAGYGQRFINSLPPTTGKIFIVAQSTCAGYNILADIFKPDPDGTTILHSTIQSALDAAVTNRDDYIIVVPDSSDYDITAAITVTKSRIHILCLAGLGHKGLPANAVRIHQETAATGIFTVTGDAVEIAGFFFKGSLNGSIINLSGTRWHPHIHDNFFGMSASSAGSANYGVYGTGAVSHASIHDNYLTNYSPGAMSGANNLIAGFIAFTSASSTRGIIRDNYMHTGANTTVAAGILNAGYGMFISGNHIWEDKVFGASEAGILTLGINNSVDSFVANNRIGITTAANAVSGGTLDESYCDNLEGTGGGTLAT